MLFVIAAVMGAASGVMKARRAARAAGGSLRMYSAPLSHIQRQQNSGQHTEKRTNERMVGSVQCGLADQEVGSRRGSSPLTTSCATAYSVVVSCAGPSAKEGEAGEAAQA